VDRDTTVVIQMDWAGEATHCVIAVGTDAPPKKATGADVIRISKKQFERDGRLILSLKKQKSYLSLFAEFDVEGKSEYSKGVPIETPFDFRQQLPVSYSTEFKPSVIKPFKVKFSFTCETDCGELPEMVVVRSKWFDSNRYDKDSEELGSIRVTLKKKLFGSVYVGECVFNSEPLRTEKAFYKLYFRDSATGIKLVPKLK